MLADRSRGHQTVAWPDPCAGAAQSDPAPWGPRVRAGPDDLPAWIAGLRGRVTRGELAGRGPVEVGGRAALPAELAARLMLADLDHHHDLPAARRRDLLVVARRRFLLRDLRRLRAQIG
jgi:hypothetical protein